MMIAIENNTKQSSLGSKGRSPAAFVPTDTPRTDGIKYRLTRILNQNLSGLFLRWKRPINSVIQRPRLWASHVDWDTVKTDLAQWGVEVFIEGSLANFATYCLLGVPFTVPMILAHGIVIVQGLSIYKRLGQHGRSTEIPKKDK
jgi:hypothetical protein